ncbi:MAG TPA: hypothetical protein V6D18_01755 [Thermosynechococcaceae cyanobacterium]
MAALSGAECDVWLTPNLFLIQAVGYSVSLSAIGWVYFRSMGGRLALKSRPATNSHSRQDAKLPNS